MKQHHVQHILWLALCCVLLPLLSGCGVCGNTISQTVLSPDGQLKAVVFQRECGATTGFSTQISVLAADETLPDWGGNVFVENKGDPIKVVWQGNRRLVIRHKPIPFTSKKQLSVDISLVHSETVTIDYAP